MFPGSQHRRLWSTFELSYDTMRRRQGSEYSVEEQHHSAAYRQQLGEMAAAVKDHAYEFVGKAGVSLTAQIVQINTLIKHGSRMCLKWSAASRT